MNVSVFLFVEEMSQKEKNDFWFVQLHEKMLEMKLLAKHEAYYDLISSEVPDVYFRWVIELVNQNKTEHNDEYVLKISRASYGNVNLLQREISVKVTDILLQNTIQQRVDIEFVRTEILRYS